MWTKKLLFILIILFWVVPCKATVYMDMDWDNWSCNHQITGVGGDNGTTWVTTYGGWYADENCGCLSGGDTDPLCCNLPQYTRCTLTYHQGSYLELDIPQSANPPRTGGFFQLYPNGTINFDSNTTYYMGAMVRFERVGGVDIWDDTGNGVLGVDKLFDIAGYNMRLTLHNGWNEMYNCDVLNCNHHFTMNLWIPSSIGCNCATDGDRTFHNVSPYSRTNPMMLDYEKWYTFVMGIKPRTAQTGELHLWINGIKVIELTGCRTVSSEADDGIGVLDVNGTINQSGYDAPHHKRQMDNFVIADTLQDMIDAGLMSDPEGGGDTTPPVVTISTSDPSNITSNSLSISGTASDAVGVTSCKYRIGSAPDATHGTAITGTTSWSGTATGFAEGANTLYVGCTDASSNWGSDSITVNLNTPPAQVKGITIKGGLVK